VGETRIEWADAVWNPVTGCSKVSPGCKNCYGERFARRLAGRFGYPADEPFRVTLHHDRLREPFGWRKPFVISMSDLFHPEVPDRFIAAVFGVMAQCPQHRFMVLTKRPERMLEWFEWVEPRRAWPWPMSHVWLGVSAENQEYADRRIPLLLQVPAAVRFVSVEPILGPVNLGRLVWFKEGFSDPDFQDRVLGRRRLDWVICGSETGPGARPANPDWVRSLRDQCVAANVPFFFKRWFDGSHLIDGQEWRQMPRQSRREYGG